MKRVILSPPEHFNVTHIKLDGSKSISNRLLILQQISSKPFKIENLSTSDDSQLMQSFFSNFPQEKEFNVQNAGTVSRFLTAFLAVQPGSWVLQCAEPMKKRPIRILVDALRQLGADIAYLEKEGFLPLQINGKRLTNNELTIAADVSSQYISALMMIAPTLPHGLRIRLNGEIASKPYLEITQGLMQQTGFYIEFEENSINILPGQSTHIPSKIYNESDWSAAAFYYTIMSISQFQELTLTTLYSPKESTQGDSIVSTFFNKLGVKTSVDNQTVKLTKQADWNAELTLDFLDQPDMVPAIAVACAAKGVQTTFTGVRNLVIKESNRLVALQNELKKLGVQFTEITNDCWELKGKIDKERFSTVEIETYEDHRIAMAFGCLGFIGEGLTILEPHVVSKSYANFWDDMKALGLKIRLLH